MELLQKDLLNLEQWISRIIPSTEDIDMTVFLTVVVENLHAVSHMKHETFSMYEYALDIGKNFKEATKRSVDTITLLILHPIIRYPSNILL